MGSTTSAPSIHPDPRLTNLGSYVTFSHIQGWIRVGQEMGEGWEGQWCATRQWKDVFVSICFSARPSSTWDAAHPAHLWSRELSAGVRVVVSPEAAQAPGQLPGGRVGVSGTAVLQGTKTSVRMDETPVWPSAAPCRNEPGHGHMITISGIIAEVLHKPLLFCCPATEPEELSISHSADNPTAVPKPPSVNCSGTENS